MFQMFRPQGCDLGAPLTPLCETPLHLALEWGAGLPLVDFILENESSPNLATKEGNTPLHYAVIHSRLQPLR